MADQKTLSLKNKNLEVIVAITKDGLPVLRRISAVGVTPTQRARTKWFEDSATPLVEVRLSHEGIAWDKSSKSMVGNRISARLEYVSHEETEDATSKTLNVTVCDAETKIHITNHLTLYNDYPVLRGHCTIKNKGAEPVILHHLTSLMLGGLTQDEKWWKNYTISKARSTWFREAQWETHDLPEVGVDDYGLNGYPEAHPCSQHSYFVSNRGSFSTNGHLPMGMLQRKDESETWVWQIENNGSWKWDLGDFHDDLYVALSGPTSYSHDFAQKLATGEQFTTVPAAVAYTNKGTDAAFGALTSYRRAIRRVHADNKNCAVIFNDYMNCLMGDPTDEKVMALVEPALKAGAEYFCIDCGWYADDSNWWDDVGEWLPSKKRFPSGFTNLMTKIREAGLIPGVWLEPEVVGIRNVVAERLPAECFFQQNGKRLREKGRYLLDYRHPETIKWMNSVIDRIVLDYGVGYFKFDYNVEVVTGTDHAAFSTGAAQLEHQRAYLRWVNGLYDRHPDLVIETCSSGGQRLDWAMLATHSIQSTSDQQCPVRYAAIASAVPTCVTPEQAASWAYPQASWDDEKNAMTVVNSLLGRVHLSGHLGNLSKEQFDLVAEGIDLYKREIRAEIPRSMPFWPIGFPKWHDDWVALGLATEDEKTAYVAVYRRGGGRECSLPIRPAKGKDVKVELLYPKFEAEAAWDAEKGSLEVKLPERVCARLYRLRFEE
ncbi:hypothetical protein KEM55_003054 [Ascosphaera atra]|nr:hypothetical protein KEM55_003054 [Ascosphaera atra]